MITVENERMYLIEASLNKEGVLRAFSANLLTEWLRNGWVERRGWSHYVTGAGKDQAAEWAFESLGLDPETLDWKEGK